METIDSKFEDTAAEVNHLTPKKIVLGGLVMMVGGNAVVAASDLLLGTEIYYTAGVKATIMASATLYTIGAIGVPVLRAYTGVENAMKRGINKLFSMYYKRD
jgi:hypothetical protein